MTCENRSVPTDIEERIVVSESGEQWSPKMPLETTAPMVRRIFASMATAMGIAMGIIMEKVPQLVPVQKAITAPIRKIIAGQKAPLTVSPVLVRFRV